MAKLPDTLFAFSKFHSALFPHVSGGEMEKIMAKIPHNNFPIKMQRNLLTFFIAVLLGRVCLSISKHLEYKASIFFSIT